MAATTTGQQEPATDHQNGAENGRAKQRVNDAQEPKEKIEGKVYKDYLKLDSLLSNVDMMSFRHGNPVHDEHLFISKELLIHMPRAKECVVFEPKMFALL